MNMEITKTEEEQELAISLNCVEARKNIKRLCVKIWPISGKGKI